MSKSPQDFGSYLAEEREVLGIAGCGIASVDLTPSPGHFDRALVRLLQANDNGIGFHRVLSLAANTCKCLSNVGVRAVYIAKGRIEYRLHRRVSGSCWLRPINAASRWMNCKVDAGTSIAARHQAATVTGTGLETARVKVGDTFGTPCLEPVVRHTPEPGESRARPARCAVPYQRDPDSFPFSRG